MKERKEVVVALRDVVEQLRGEGILSEQAGILSRLAEAVADLDHGVVAPMLTPVRPWKGGKSTAPSAVLLRVAGAALVEAKIKTENLGESTACRVVTGMFSAHDLRPFPAGEGEPEEQLRAYRRELKATQEDDDPPEDDEALGLWRNFLGLIRREPNFAIDQLERLIKDCADSN